MMKPIVVELYPSRARVQLLKPSGKTAWATMDAYLELKKLHPELRFIENIVLEPRHDQLN